MSQTMRLYSQAHVVYTKLLVGQSGFNHTVTIMGSYRVSR